MIHITHTHTHTHTHVHAMPCNTFISTSLNDYCMKIAILFPPILYENNPSFPAKYAMIGIPGMVAVEWSLATTFNVSCSDINVHTQYLVYIRVTRNVSPFAVR